MTPAILPVPGPSARPDKFGPEAQNVRKAAHRALANVSEDIAKLRFNRCVAHIYECANALSDAIGSAETVFCSSATRSRTARRAGWPGLPLPGDRCVI